MNEEILPFCQNFTRDVEQIISCRSFEATVKLECLQLELGVGAVQSVIQNQDCRVVLYRRQDQICSKIMINFRLA